MPSKLGRWWPVACHVAFLSWVCAEFALSYSQQQPAAVGIAFNLIALLMGLCLVRLIATDPGRVPASWAVTAAESDDTPLPPQLAERKFDGSRRICRKSNPPVYKPDRCHYCRMSRRCVLKMDHFDPWSNSCVGFWNYKYYFLFLFYRAAACLSLLILMLAHMQQSIWFVTKLLVLALFTVGCLALLGFHIRLVTSNHTTIEFLEKRGMGNRDPGYVNRYDLGVWGNVTQVFGTNVLMWPFPVRYSVPGDGLSFPASARLQQPEML